MNLTRDEVRQMIVHVATLMVAEAESWQKTYGPEARKCPTCGHDTIQATEQQEFEHRQVCQNLQSWKMFYYGQLSASGVSFGAKWTVSGDAGQMCNYRLESMIQKAMQEAGHEDGISYDSESGCLFIYTRTKELGEVVLAKAKELSNEADLPDDHCSFHLNEPEIPNDIDFEIGNWSYARQLLDEPERVEAILDTIEGLTD
jgi:hypothetical protein